MVDVVSTLGPYQCGYRGVGGWFKLKTDAVAADGLRKVPKEFVKMPLLKPSPFFCSFKQ